MTAAPDTTPDVASVIHEAADLMRQRAQAATPGRWRDVAMGSEGSVVLAGGNTIGTARRPARCGEFADAEHIASWSPPAALAVAELLDSVAQRHYPVEWSECGEDGTPDPSRPLPPFCAACTDEEWVSAIEYGDVIDQSADTKGWPCADAARALAIARAYLGRPAQEVADARA